MEFITAEQFLKEDKEVQKVFINWWKPSLFDLYCYKDDLKIRRVTETDLQDISNNYLYNPKSKFAMPVFTEGQLRKFIEDKTRSYFSCEIINPLVNEEGFRFVFEFYSGKEFKYNEKLKKEIYAIDLLQAYWKVAVQIAKEEVLNEKNNKNNK